MAQFADFYGTQEQIDQGKQLGYTAEDYGWRCDKCGYVVKFDIAGEPPKNCENCEVTNA